MGQEIISKRITSVRTDDKKLLFGTLKWFWKIEFYDTRLLIYSGPLYLSLSDMYVIFISILLSYKYSLQFRVQLLLLQLCQELADLYNLRVKKHYLKTAFSTGHNLFVVLLRKIYMHKCKSLYTMTWAS